MGEEHHSSSQVAMRFTPHRRAVLGGLGAAAVTGLIGADRVRAVIAPVTHKVGSAEVMVISDGVLNVPLSFSLPETPLSEAAALFKAHGMPEGGEPVQTNVVLVKTGKDTVLIDAGSGANFQPTAGKLQENLEAAGIAPDVITKVVFTHAHADHLWGVLDDFDDAGRFPNASYVISAAEWDFWSDPRTAETVPDWLKGMALGTARILKKIEDKVERRKAGDTVAPGLTYTATPGHTPGHMSVMVENGGQQLIIGGDVLANNAISFARPEWRIGSDFDRDRAVATRKSLLDQLATDKIPLVGFHLAWPGLGMVERTGNVYRLASL
jgi:glyoxylase-like metal-dependent hydrolase (beta-lactamase superfamily II)